MKVDRYFSSRLILLMDVLVSVASSLFILQVNCALLSHAPAGLVLSAVWGTVALLSSLLMFMGLRTYKSIIRYSTLRDMGLLCLGVLGKTALLALLLLWMLEGHGGNPLLYWTLPFDFLLTFGALVLVRVALLTAYDVVRSRLDNRRRTQRILIYGDGEKAISQEVRLRSSGHYRVAGFLVFGRRERHTLAGFKVYYFENEKDVQVLSDRLDVDAVLFPYHADARSEQERLLRYCTQCGLQALISPSIDLISDGRIPTSIRKVRIEDLLGRAEIRISMEEVIAGFNDRTILVTGAAGSIGSELCRQVAGFGIKHLVMYDNAETPLHNLRLEFEDRFPGVSFTPVIGDVRMPARLDYVFRRFHPEIVFHAAAYKHVPLMEENPCEAVLVNVAGSRNVADKCLEYDVDKMVMISTDKAVNPTNIMGCTKRLAEIYVQSLGLAVAGKKIEGRTKFVTTRFGNVLGSNGSVIPRFQEQILRGGPVTVTHREITRFFMTIPEACRLVMEAATISSGNEICVFDMGEPVRIAHLAEQMIELSGLRVGEDIKIEFTGLRPGEKLYEEVLASAENTLPTSHERIKVAQVRKYVYEDARRVADELEELSRRVNIPEMVELMKRTVPEFTTQRKDV